MKFVLQWHVKPNAITSIDTESKRKWLFIYVSRENMWLHGPLEGMWYNLYTSLFKTSCWIFLFSLCLGVSVSVSTFNLVAISLERYSAICNPLTSRTWQTKSHAAKVITATWVASFILMLPYPISSTLKPFTRLNNSTGHMCRLVWPNDVIQQSWWAETKFTGGGIVLQMYWGMVAAKTTCFRWPLNWISHSGKKKKGVRQTHGKNSTQFKRLLTCMVCHVR